MFNEINMEREKEREGRITEWVSYEFYVDSRQVQIAVADGQRSISQSFHISL